MKQLKRKPRDPNRLAFEIVRISTEDTEGKTEKKSALPRKQRKIKAAKP
jgi:hypothetical protein